MAGRPVLLPGIGPGPGPPPRRRWLPFRQALQLHEVHAELLEAGGKPVRGGQGRHGASQDGFGGGIDRRERLGCRDGVGAEPSANPELVLDRPAPAGRRRAAARVHPSSGSAPRRRPTLRQAAGRAHSGVPDGRSLHVSFRRNQKDPTAAPIPDAVRMGSAEMRPAVPCSSAQRGVDAFSEALRTSAGRPLRSA